MKKLLVLALVLGIASLASAALQFFPDRVELKPSDTIVITVMSDAIGYTEMFIGVDEQSAAAGEMSFVGGTVFPAAGDLAKIIPYDYAADEYEGADFVAQDTALLPDWTPGEWFQFVFHCDGIGDEWVTIEVYDYLDPSGGTEVVHSILIHQVPEPASLLLLGLGGLFLRRK